MSPRPTTGRSEDGAEDADRAPTPPAGSSAGGERGSAGGERGSAGGKRQSAGGNLESTRAVRSARGKLVYRALAAREEATAEELRAATGVPKLMLYGVLGALVERGVVTVEGDVYGIPDE